MTVTRLTRCRSTGGFFFLSSSPPVLLLATSCLASLLEVAAAEAAVAEVVATPREFWAAPPLAQVLDESMVAVMPSPPEALSPPMAINVPSSAPPGGNVRITAAKDDDIDVLAGGDGGVLPGEDQPIDVALGGKINGATNNASLTQINIALGWRRLDARCASNQRDHGAASDIAVERKLGDAAQGGNGALPFGVSTVMFPGNPLLPGT